MSSKTLHCSSTSGAMGDQKDVNSGSFDLIQNHIESLSGKMDRLINIQEKVLNRLDGLSQDIGDIEQDMETIRVDKEEIHITPSVTNPAQALMRGEVKLLCQEMNSIMSAVNQRSEQQAQKLEGMEKLVLNMQQMISFIGETVKSSRIMELMLKGPAARKASRPKDKKGKVAIKRQSSADAIAKKADKKPTSTKAKGTQEISSACEPSTPEPSHKIKHHGPKPFLSSRKRGTVLKEHKSKETKEKPCLSLKGQKAQKKKKPPDAADVSLKKQILLLEEVQKLNRENEGKSEQRVPSEHLDPEAGGALEGPQLGSPGRDLPDFHLEDTKAPPEPEKQDVPEVDGVKEVAKVAFATETESKLEEEDVIEVKEELLPEEQKENKKASPETSSIELPSSEESEKEPIASSDDHKGSSSPAEEEQDQIAEGSHVTVEDGRAKGKEEEGEEEEKKEDGGEGGEDGWGIFVADNIQFQLKELRERVEKERKEAQEKGEEDEDEDEYDEPEERYFIDNSLPPDAPFSHRIVMAKPNQINNFYSINRQEIIGGGRFGQVHKCVENSSGLTFAAKIIKARTLKEKEVVKNEIHVMNQLAHASLIQLYAAYESRNDIILVLEYVDGGELFDRIIDENYTLKELDTIMFIRQICEGLQHMHKMYILHLDLKPENILCVSRATNKVKIIDFGLARVYKPKEKLKVNFGTPEFLAPEVINYEYVSFNTDMWSLGVIAYMLLSGLCPFLGDDDTQTLNNILKCSWSFEEEEFIETSEEAKDFISKLLVTNKCWRMGASEALKHPWLSDPVLHHRLYTKKTMCRSRRSSCVPPSS